MRKKSGLQFKQGINFFSESEIKKLENRKKNVLIPNLNLFDVPFNIVLCNELKKIENVYNLLISKTYLISFFYFFFFSISFRWCVNRITVEYLAHTKKMCNSNDWRKIGICFYFLYICLVHKKKKETFLFSLLLQNFYGNQIPWRIQLPVQVYHQAIFILCWHLLFSLLPLQNYSVYVKIISCMNVSYEFSMALCIWWSNIEFHSSPYDRKKTKSSIFSSFFFSLLLAFQSIFQRCNAIQCNSTTKQDGTYYALPNGLSHCKISETKSIRRFVIYVFFLAGAVVVVVCVISYFYFIVWWCTKR